MKDEKFHLPNAAEYINNIFTGFIELHGDRICGDDSAIVGGLAYINGIPITLISQMRGNTLEEQVKYNFSMTSPEGYRKSLRLMKQAEKFSRPIICLIDTIGASPSLLAESHGQATAISNNISGMLDLKVPIISIVIGCGYSGGALALCASDCIAIVENAEFNVISPRAYSQITRRSSNDTLEFVDPYDLMMFGIVDKVLSSKHTGSTGLDLMEVVKAFIVEEICKLSKINSNNLVKKRYQKFRCLLE